MSNKEFVPAPSHVAEIDHNYGLHENDRGEYIDANLQLYNDPENGSTWKSWTQQNLPTEIFKTFGLIDHEGSEDWVNVIEHTAVVAGAALALGTHLQEAGVSVNLSEVIRATWVHDATKRRDVVKGITREDESSDDALSRVLESNGYKQTEIAAAKNTGRLPDRYIEDPIERIRVIASRAIEENIVGYVDACTRGSEYVGIERARLSSISAKPKDDDFFNNHWAPYYFAVEGYLKALSPGFAPASINNSTILKAITESSL